MVRVGRGRGEAGEVRSPTLRAALVDLDGLSFAASLHRGCSGCCLEAKQKRRRVGKNEPPPAERLVGDMDDGPTTQHVLQALGSSHALSGPASSSRPASYLSLPRVIMERLQVTPPPHLPCEPPKLMYFDAKQSTALHARVFHSKTSASWWTFRSRATTRRPSSLLARRGRLRRKPRPRAGALRQRQGLDW